MYDEPINCTGKFFTAEYFVCWVNTSRKTHKNRSYIFLTIWRRCRDQTSVMEVQVTNGDHVEPRSNEKVEVRPTIIAEHSRWAASGAFNAPWINASQRHLPPAAFLRVKRVQPPSPSIHSYHSFPVATIYAPTFYRFTYLSSYRANFPTIFLSLSLSLSPSPCFTKVSRFNRSNASSETWFRGSGNFSSMTNFFANEEERFARTYLGECK